MKKAVNKTIEVPVREDASPLKAIRKDLDLTILQLAQLCGCSTAAINYAEQGRDKVSDPVLRKLSEWGYDVDVVQQAQNTYRAAQLARLTAQVEQALRNKAAA